MKINNLKFFNFSAIMFVSLAHFGFGQSITRQQILNNADSYVNYNWNANACNLWNGTYCGGRNIYSCSWVNIGTNVSMPYAWGGFSSQLQHDNAMLNCVSAGDQCSTNGGGCSNQGGSGAGLGCTSGLDCSGLVSRSWGLSSHYGTGQLPNISTSYLSLSQVQPGDILNIVGSHTRLITSYNGSSYTVIESSGTDWKTAYHSYTPVQLSSYNPRYYNYVLTGGAPSNDDCNGAISLTSSTSCNYTLATVNDATADYFSIPSCDTYPTPSNILGAGVFFKFIAVATTHTITVDPVSSGSAALDAVVVVYGGSNCYNLQEVPGGCMDQPGGGGGTTTLTVNNLTIGEQYWIRVYDFGSTNTTSGDFNICVTHTAPICTYSFSPSNAMNLSAAGYSGSFTVNTQPGCSFVLDADANCLPGFTINNLTGSGTTTFNFTVPANPGSTMRACTLSVQGTGVTFPITQVGTTTQSYTVNLSANPTVGGIPTGGGSFISGQNTTLQANPNNGYSFSNWTENSIIIGTAPSLNITVNNNRNIVANYIQGSQTCNLMVTANPSTGGVVSGAGNYVCGLNATVIATPNSGWSFLNWMEGSIIVETNSAYSFQINTNRDLIASFIPIDGLPDENVGKELFSVFPNPSSAFINITFHEAINEVSILYFMDVQGKVLFKKEFDDITVGYIYSIDLSTLPAAVYVIHYIYNNSVYVKRIIVQ